MARKNITDKQVVEAYIQSRKEHMNRWPYEILQEQTGECEKVCYKAMERACDRGYIDYGITLRSGWVTKEGMKLLI